MKQIVSRAIALALVTFAFLPLALLAQGDMASHNAKVSSETEATVVELTQIPGEFTTEKLTLKPGSYRFKVANVGVGHDVGFVIQRAEDKDADVMKTALPNSFSTAPIPQGTVGETGVVELTPGEYVYSCPLNPTPHYLITVE